MSVNAVSAANKNIYLHNELEKLEKKNKTANVSFISGMGLLSCNYIMRDVAKLKINPILSFGMALLGGTSMLLGLMKSFGTYNKMKEIKQQVNTNA